MRIQYASDLHLEFADNWRYLKANPLEVTGDILLLAGDIGYLGDDNYSKHPFWKWAADNYKEVHCCMGNHEFYKFYDVASLPDGYLLEIRPNVFSHYNGIVRMGDTDIILSTLWSRIPSADAIYTEQVISDFHRIMYNGKLMTSTQFGPRTLSRIRPSSGAEVSSSSQNCSHTSCSIVPHAPSAISRKSCKRRIHG